MAADGKAYIVVVEDELTNIMIIRHLLDDLGDLVGRVEYALSAAAFFCFFAQRPAEEAPDVILLDMQLPAVSGIEIAQQIKANPRFAKTTLVAVTAAYDQPGLQKAALANGITGFIKKPLKADIFNHQLQAILRGGIVWEGRFL